MKTYRFLWAEERVLFKSKHKDFLGICGYSRRVAKLCPAKNIMVLLIVRDTYVDEERKQCEEEKRCLDFDCPLNKTTKETYAKAYRIPIRKLPPDFGKKPLAFNTHSCEDILTAHPNGGIVVKKPRRKS